MAFLRYAGWCGTLFHEPGEALTTTSLADRRLRHVPESYLGWRRTPFGIAGRCISLTEHQLSDHDNQGEDSSSVGMSE